MTLVIDTTSLTKDRRTKFIETLEPTFELSETESVETGTTTFELARRDRKEMTARDGRDATLVV